MKYRFKIIKILRKIILHVYFKIDPIKCSRFLGVKIGKNCKIYGGNPNMWGTEPFLIKIGDNVHITDGCRFVTHDGGTLILRKFQKDLEITKPIEIGSDVYIGLQSLIMPGVKIEDNVIIGARSIVTANISTNSVVVGSPARKIKTIDDYFDKISQYSLEIGHLSGQNKEKELKKIFKDFINN